LAAFTPIALTAHVVTSLVHLGGTPGQVFCQVSLIPGALVVDHTVEPEGEDAGEAG